MLNKAEAEKRDFNEKEEIEYKGLDAHIAQLEAGLNAPSKVISLAARGGNVHEAVAPHGEIGASWPKLFHGRDDAQIPVVETAQDFCKRMVATRAMIAGTMADGGASVPEFWWADIYFRALAESIALPRVLAFPMPSNILHIAAMDSEDQSAGYFGGVSASWQGENQAATEVSPKLRMVSLKTWKLSMYVSASREVVEDSGGNLAGVLQNQMVYALTQSADETILTGDGVAKPLGVIHSPARVDYSRAAANAISFADIVGMYARLHASFMRGAVWVAHPSTIPQLCTIVDAGSHNLWVQSAAANVPPTMLGMPVLFTDKVPALGARGDLSLINFGAYAVGMRNGTTLEHSNSVHWANDCIAFRVIMRWDGSSLLDTPITPRTGGSTLSPFVILN